MACITRRSTRSFVESELDADLRELSLSEYEAFASGISVSSSSSATGSSASSTYLLEDTEMSEKTAQDIEKAVEKAASDEKDVEEIVSPPGAPVNFGAVMPGIYRSSYPQPEHYSYLSTLGLKTIITLVDKNYTDDYGAFIAANNIRHHMFAMKGTKKENIPIDTMSDILALVLDRANYPLLVHCNQGRHRTGCVVGVLRAIADWQPLTITDEYRLYAGAKPRDCDLEYIRGFDLGDIEGLLSRDDLRVDLLVADSNISKSENEKTESQTPQAVAAPVHRFPQFIRNACFSMTVLLIWIVSGVKMPSGQ